jgi:chromodomain-helicase-DNA-binding protein 1
MHYTSRKKIDPEEYEQHMVARESERESQRDFHIVERVIGTRDGDDETEYFVKCKHHRQPNCPYSDYLTLSREGFDL